MTKTQDTGNVVCAIDVNDFDQHVVDIAALFADQFDTALDLIHVTLFPDPAGAAWPGYVGSPDPIVENYRRLQQVSTGVPDVAVHHHHLTGIPHDQVLKFVKQNPPRLLVLGTHARKGISRLLGSESASILRRADCPVMVIRQRQNSQQLAETQ